MDKINQINEKINNLMGEKLATEKLFNDMPSSIPLPDSLYWHNSKLNEFSFKYEIETLTQALQIIQSLNKYILPLNLVQGSFTSFLTKKHKEKIKKSDEVTPVFPITVKVSHFGLTFEFYMMIKGHLISVDVTFKHGANFEKYAKVYFNRNRFGREIKRDGSKLMTPAFKYYEKITWSSGSNTYPNDVTLYWYSNIISTLSEAIVENFQREN